MLFYKVFGDEKSEAVIVWMVSNDVLAAETFFVDVFEVFFGDSRAFALNAD